MAKRLLHPEFEAGRTAGQAHRQVWAYAAVLERIPPALYSSLVLSEKLYSHLLEIDEAADARMEILMPQLMKAAGVTEELKATYQMKWVGLANACKSQAEKIILAELVFEKFPAEDISKTL